MRSYLALAATAVIAVLATLLATSGPAYSSAMDVITVSGDFHTDGSNDPQDLFPNGTPGPGTVTISNDGPGTVTVTVKDEDGNDVGSGEAEPGGTDPTFTVPSGGTVIVVGKTSKDADGTYVGSFVVNGQGGGGR